MYIHTYIYNYIYILYPSEVFHAHGPNPPLQRGGQLPISIGEIDSISHYTIGDIPSKPNIIQIFHVIVDTCLYHYNKSYYNGQPRINKPWFIN